MSSQSYRLREQIKAHLVAQVAGISNDNLIIDRKHSITEEIQASTGWLSTGLMLTLLPVRGQTVDPRSRTLLFDGTSTLTTWTNPTLADPQLEETIHDAAMEALHHQELAIHINAKTRVRQRISVLGFQEVDDPEFLRRDTFLQSEYLGVLPG